MALRLAIMLTALALVPSGAHLAALPSKMAKAQALLHRPADLRWMGSLRHRPFRRFGGESGAHDLAVQAGPIIRLRARLIFAYCC